MAEYTHIRCPDCGGPVPQGARCCRDCIVRDDEFVLLDTLDAMGYGDVSQEKIPPDVIARARANPIPRAARKAPPGPKPVKTPRPPCPRCQGQVKFRCIQRRIGRLYVECRSCAHRFHVDLAA
jgi:hypothetical protein